MLINSNDIFNQIGLAVDPSRRSNYNSKPKYVISLEIQLSEDEKHLLQVRDYDDPHRKAVEFCDQYKLNKLAIGILENKIRQAMELKEQSIIKYHKKTSNKKEREKQRKDNYSQNNIASKSKQKEKQKSQKKQSNNPTSNKVTEFGNQGSNSPYQSKSKSKSKSQTKNKKSEKKPVPEDNIYLRGLVKSKIIKDNRNKLKVQMDKRQEEQLTFKPKINNVSQKIVEFLKTNNIPKQKRSSPVKLMYDEMKQCTFKPKLNKLSQKIVGNKSLIQQQRENHKNLYNEDKSAKKQKQIEKEYSFKPQINPKSAETVTVPFFKRLQLNQEKRNQAINKKTFYDQQQCSFQPKINRGPLRDRNKQNMKIWDYLHYGSKSKVQVERQQIHAQSNITQSNKQTTASQRYYENLVQDRIRNVFVVLDSDHDGLISPNLIAIEELPVECLHFLKPVFIQMDEINASLNYYEFKRAVQALMNESDPGAKGAFLAAKWKKQIQQKDTFKPSINSRSRQMSVNRSVQNLYREGLKQKQSREYRLDRERALKQQKQLMQCSFKPVLAHSSKVYIDKITKRSENNKQIKQSKSICDLMYSHQQSNFSND